MGTEKKRPEKFKQNNILVKIHSDKRSIWHNFREKVKSKGSDFNILKNKCAKIIFIDVSSRRMKPMKLRVTLTAIGQTFDKRNLNTFVWIDGKLGNDYTAKV